jgi:hypothetical protein
MRIELGFGVSVQKSIMVEGVTKPDVPAPYKDDAQRAMAVLLGGKRLLVMVSKHETTDGHVPGRVFLDEFAVPDTAYMAVPYGCSEPRLELGMFVKWLAARAFSVEEVKRILNTKRLTVAVASE